MTPEEKAQFEKMQADLAKASLLATMSDKQKAHYGKLAGAEAEAFLKLDVAQRDAVIAKVEAEAASADPVLYKSEAVGDVRTSDGGKVLAMAKMVDQLVGSVNAMIKAATDGEAERLAKSWDHLGQPYEDKLALAKSILGLPEATKKSMLDNIEASRKIMAPLFKSLGSSVHNSNTGADAGPLQKLEELVDATVAKSSGKTREQVYADVLMTAQGAQLYAEFEAAKQRSLH